jgi:hypothetical protein
MSMPSRPYWLRAFTQAFVKFVRPVELAASVSKALSLPSFQPPIDSSTFTPRPCAVETRLLSFDALSIACSEPFEFGSANA